MNIHFISKSTWNIIKVATFSALIPSPCMFSAVTFLMKVYFFNWALVHIDFSRSFVITILLFSYCAKYCTVTKHYANIKTYVIIATKAFFFQMVQRKLLAFFFLFRFFVFVLFLKKSHLTFKTDLHEGEPVSSLSVLDTSVKEFCYTER